MRRTLIVIAVLTAVMMPAICSATPPRPGPYVSGFAGVSVPQNSNVTTTDFFNNTTFNDNVEFDTGVYAGGTGGFDFGFLRLEGELSYRYSDIKAVTDQTNAVQFSDVDGNLGAFSMMVNAFFDLHNASPITPYFGGGIGFAVLQLSDTTGVGPQGQVVQLYPQGDDTVFAYQVGAGLDIALNPMISLDLGYRYFGTDTASFNSNSLITTDLKLQSHNAMVGVRVKF